MAFYASPLMMRWRARHVILTKVCSYLLPKVAAPYHVSRWQPVCLVYILRHERVTLLIALQFINPPDYSKLTIDPASLQGPDLQPDVQRSQLIYKAADNIARMWTGQLAPAQARGVMHPDIREWDLLFGTSRTGISACSQAAEDAHKVCTSLQAWLFCECVEGGLGSMVTLRYLHACEAVHLCGCE